jgi:hypothetical protein
VHKQTSLTRLGEIVGANLSIMDADISNGKKGNGSVGSLEWMIALYIFTLCNELLVLYWHKLMQHHDSSRRIIRKVRCSVKKREYFNSSPDLC